MQRRELDLPLLIGGATTSRQHTAVKHRARLRRSRPSTCSTPHASSASSRTCSTTDRRAALDADNRADQQRLRTLHDEKQRKPLLPLGRRPREPDPDRLGGATDLAAPPFPARARSHRRSPSCATASTGLLLPRLGAQGPLPGHPRRPAPGSCRPRPLRRRHDAAGRDRAGRPARGARRLRLLARRRRGGRHRARRRHALPDAAPADRLRRLAAEPLARRLHRSGRDRPGGRASGAFAVAIHGADELAHEHEAGNDDYSRSSSRRWPTASRRRSRSGSTCRFAAAWYAPDEQLDADDLVARALPRHPARLRLSRLPRPLGEAAAVRAARRRGRRPGADGVVRDAARGRGQRHLLRPPAGALLLGQPHRARISSTTTRSGRP